MTTLGYESLYTPVGPPLVILRTVVPLATVGITVSATLFKAVLCSDNLRCGATFDDDFVTDLLPSRKAKEL